MANFGQFWSIFWNFLVTLYPVRRAASIWRALRSLKKQTLVSIISKRWWRQPCWAGLPDGLFSNQKNPNLGKFWRALGWKMLIYFMAIWNHLQTFRIFYDPLVHFVIVWLVLSGSGIMHQEKSGNPGVVLCVCGPRWLKTAEKSE
jgi:hypothetical protein